MGNKEKNLESRISNLESKIQDSVFSVFSLIQHSTFNIQHSTRQGFTLLETLVAISILLVAVVAPMSTIGGSLSSIFFARDQMIAVNFAQEGIEIVRQKRDSNMLNRWRGGDINWGYELSAGGYLIDATNLRTNGTLLYCASSCDTGDKKSIRQDSVTGLFYQKTPAVSVDSTQFTRIVNIADVSSSEKIVTSTVEWPVGGVMKKVEVKESIFGINS